ncbi:hypothetical protein HanIR_Chr06g0261521 [Helianthus annuus]|nr:hypothetical protein HanIR_Chr06g0261521 [Helianthus annuus]
MKFRYNALQLSPGKIPSKFGLIRRGINIGNGLCSKCEIEEDHTLFNCVWATAIWWHICAWVKHSEITDP